MVRVSDLERVTQFDVEQISYEFHIFGVFFDPRESKFYLLTDSGCSCPGEWEDERVTIETEGENRDGPFTFTEALRGLDKYSMESNQNDQGWFVDGMMAARYQFIEFAKANGTFPGNDRSEY